MKTWRDAAMFKKVVVDKCGCWNWTGYVWRHGYGCAAVPGEGRSVRAHRLAWETANGPIPDGLLVLHHCDNRRCINPDHLFLGTHGDNMRDAYLKGRKFPPPQVGETAAGAKLTDTAVREIRARRAAGALTTALAREFGVTSQHVGAICKGKTRRTA